MDDPSSLVGRAKRAGDKSISEKAIRGKNIENKSMSNEEFTEVVGNATIENTTRVHANNGTKNIQKQKAKVVSNNFAIIYNLYVIHLNGVKSLSNNDIYSQRTYNINIGSFNVKLFG